MTEKLTRGPYQTRRSWILELHDKGLTVDEIADQIDGNIPLIVRTLNAGLPPEERGANSVEFQFGQLIRTSRSNLGWSQRKLAQRMADQGFRWHHATVKRLEAGSRATTSVREMIMLAALLRFDMRLLADLVPDVKSEPECEVCHGEPPAGFKCNTCKATLDTQV